jgi:iron uptake system component EfeO
MHDERIVAEKENLPPGFSASFSRRLGGGSYRLYCPGATEEYADFKVVGRATSGAGLVGSLLTRGTHHYGKYVNNEVGLLVAGVRRLSRAIRSGDLRAARIAYAKARPYYERIEPVAQRDVAGGLNLDARIDARAGDVRAREWSGFHVIEKGLFAMNSVAGLTPVARDLQKSVERLRSVTRRLIFQPAELLDGAGGLLDDVSKSKVTGDDERYSRIDLVDFHANVEGAERAFADVEPGLARIDHFLAREILRRFTGVETLLAHYVDPNALGGYLPYERLSAGDKRKLSIAVRAAKEPLSDASSKLVAAG